jgi:hypothetical protein
MNLQNNNIIVNQISGSDGFSFIEVSPSLPELPVFPLTLCLNSEGKLLWTSLITKIPEPIVSFKTPSIFEDHKIKGTNLFFKDGKIGIGREPLYTYRFDIAVSENTLTTAFHIGDGRFGFSMGNGTNEGFLPEIIGMGSSEEDAGLYFIGRAGNTLPSSVPLIVIDGRNSADEKLTNRPIFGITSADYNTYKFIIDQNGNMGVGKKPEIYKVEIEGKISAKDFIIGEISLIDIIHGYQEEIEDLKNKIKELTHTK